MANIVTGDLYHRIDGQLLEIKRQLRQHEGYPHKPEHLQKALQEIIEGKISSPPIDDRFGMMLMSEPIIIPKIDISVCVEKYRSKMVPGIDSVLEWDHFQPSEPLRPGSEHRLYVYAARKNVTEIDCIQFIKEQGGILPNLHDLFIALEKDLLPKNNTCVILALDKEEHLPPVRAYARRAVPSVLCTEEGGLNEVLRGIPAKLGDQGTRFQWQFWGAGIDKGKCIMFFKK
jgi:hypothetical protein